jgi:hypothetical protein
MLTEKKVLDKIEVVNGMFIQVREANIIEKDGVEIARTYHRWSFSPLDDLSEQPQEVIDIANVVWTDEVIAQYQAQLEAQALPKG